MARLRVLITGGSSFSGLWFCAALTKAGHTVTAPLVRNQEGYSGTRRTRVELLQKFAAVEWQCPFGSDRFLQVAGERQFDVLCCHGAQVLDHRSPDFDVIAALAENTRSLSAVLRLMLDRSLTAIVLTGTYSEQDEGAGTPPLSAFQPYSLSKGLTGQVFRYWAARYGIRLGKFVMPNPFGPLEDERFVAHLVRSWMRGITPTVNTPRYVRDSAHVELLAETYRSYVEGTAAAAGPSRINPSGYVETQGDFARRVARELGPRLGLATPIQMLEQVDFAEPQVRINTEPMDWKTSGLSEKDCWQHLADYYVRSDSSAGFNAYLFGK